VTGCLRAVAGLGGLPLVWLGGEGGEKGINEKARGAALRHAKRRFNGLIVCMGRVKKKAKKDRLDETEKMFGK